MSFKKTYLTWVDIGKVDLEISLYKLKFIPGSSNENGVIQQMYM